LTYNGVEEKMIESIELSNWKAFPSLKLSLSEGINFVAGPNGIGKSSILQAICVAFTGQVPDGIEMRDCIRRGSESASIQLDFRRGDEILRIYRSLSLRAREKCSVRTSTDQKTFEGSWDEATNYIENLLKIQTFLFNNLMFMSEGDVYRSIREPPGKQLLNEIDRLLGITQLQSLANEVCVARKEFQEKISKQQQLLERTETRTETKEDLNVIRNSLLELQKSRDREREDRKVVTRELWAKKDQIREIEALLNDLLFLKKEKDELSIEKNKAANLQKQLSRIQNEIEILNRDKIATETEISSYQKIFDIIGEAQRVEGLGAQCPVCKRPISQLEIEEIKKELLAQKESKESKMLDIIKRLSILDTDRKNLEPHFNVLKEKEIRLKALEEKYKDQAMKFDEAKKRIVELTAEVEFLENKSSELEESLALKEAEVGNLREEIGRVESAEQYKGLEKSEIVENLKTAFIGEYLSEFTLSGIEELLSEQRDSKLRKKLYNSISDVWGKFKGETGWSVTLDQAALPSPQQESQTYPFHLLSAGEKTALLVVTRTMLSTLFTKNIGFLLLDEPLEHLDQRNRHSLLQFLVDAHKEGIVRQLIVTTTEASLLRKFVDEENVNIIPLSRSLG
jgi:exonuclease SbcC